MESSWTDVVAFFVIMFLSGYGAGYLLGAGAIFYLLFLIIYYIDLKKRVKTDDK